MATKKSSPPPPAPSDDLERLSKAYDAASADLAAKASAGAYKKMVVPTVDELAKEKIKIIDEMAKAYKAVASSKAAAATSFGLGGASAPGPGGYIMGAHPGVDPGVWDVIKRYAPVTDYDVVQTQVGAEKKEPDYAPPAPTPRTGWELFSKVFGWAPTLVPDFLVPMFSEADWPASVAGYIPDKLPNGGVWSWPHKSTERLCFALFVQDDRTLLHGPTGAGKSALVQAVAFMLRIPLVRVNCHRDMQSTDFLGKDIIRATPQGPVLEYDWSLTTLAAKCGGILLIDEAFRSPCLMAIQSLLERHGTLTLPDAASLQPGERRVVPPPGRSWIALTDNTVGVGDDSGAYVAEVQDVSTLDRITAVIHVGYMTPAEEESALRALFPTAPQKTLSQVARWSERIRSGFLNRTFQHSLSLRGTSAIVRKFLGTGNLAFAVQAAFLDKLTGAELHAAKEAWYSVNGKELTL